ncbi:hypothetical protein APT_10054 (plasmid) [Acetobacter pasteurianus NBRC 101655]|nr:hypothetical protein APT_10054 [Acetobacter pasteurianus NBRC 101655]
MENDRDPSLTSSDSASFDEHIRPSLSVLTHDTNVIVQVDMTRLTS